MGASKAFSDVAIDVDGDPLRYTWNFGDGSPLVVGQSVSHVYLMPGIFTYAVFVDDLTGILGHNVSSSATVTVPFVLQTAAGWNLISIPVVGTVYTAGTLGLSMPDIVSRWNSATMTYTSFVVGLSPQSSDFALEPGVGYWVYTGSPRTLSLIGNVPTAPQSTVITVPTGGGWALIGFASMSQTMMASNIPAMFSGAGVVAISSWNAVTQTYKTYAVGLPIGDYAIAPGHAYWIYVTGSGTLSYTP